nr:basic amino acid ABC transporter substrate-binding protein [Chromobacterium sp. ASV5]
MDALKSVSKAWLAMAVMCVGLAGCGQQGGDGSKSAGVATPAPKGHEYVVGSDASYPPFEFAKADGQLAGFDVELLTAIAAREGFRVRFVNMSWESIFSALQQEDVDILASAVSITEERRQSMAFSEPYFASRQLVAVRRQDGDIVGLDELRGRKLAAQPHSTGDEALQRLVPEHDIRRIDSIPTALSLLAKGEVAGVVADGGALNYYVRVKGDGKLRVLADKQLPAIEYYGFAVRQDQPELLAKINAGLAALKADGSYDTIYRKYFGKDGA